MRFYETYEWFTLFLMIALLALASAKILNTLKFVDFIKVIGNSKYIKIYSKTQKFFDWFDAFLFINLVISVSVVFYFSLSEFFFSLDLSLVVFLKLLLAVSSLILIKTLLERLLGSLFQIDQIMDHYLFMKITYKNYSGLVFFATSVLLIYTALPKNVVIYLCIGTICLIHFVGFLGLIKTYQNLIITNIFYFLLYLCTLEIGPYILLYKAIKDYNA